MDAKLELLASPYSVRSTPYSLRTQARKREARQWGLRQVATATVDSQDSIRQSEGQRGNLGGGRGWGG